MQGNILVPVDGSENSDRAVRFAIEFLKGGGGKLHLLNVQAPVGGGVRAFVKKADIEAYHREEGEKALAPARAKLDAAGVKYEAHITVGEEAGAAIARFAEEKKCGQLVMGTRGLGRVAGALLGSVTTQAISLVEVPILLVK